MKENPKISIIVPIYKTDYIQLKECLESLTNQSYQNIEILLIDDGSPDKCGAICDQYQKNDSRIIVKHKANEGVSCARNTALDIATGDYIIFVDSDDYISLDLCNTLIHMQKKFPDSVIFFNYAKVFKKNIVPISITNKRFSIYIRNEKSSLNIYDMKIMGYITHTLFPRELIKNERFDINLPNSQDIEFNFRVFPLIKKAIFCNEILYYYRQNENSAVRKYDKQKSEKYIKTIPKIKYDRNNKLQTEAYYSFISITFIMLILNTIFNINNKISYHDKKQQIKHLMFFPCYKDLFKHIKFIRIPLSRKCIIYFAKLHLFTPIYFIIKVKQFLDLKRNKVD